MLGSALGHYRITAALGAGGMGEVWKATDTDPSIFQMRVPNVDPGGCR
jgi:hypothetical protein